MKKITYSKKLYLIAQLKFLAVLLVFIIILVLDFRYGIGRANFTIKTFEMLFVLLLGFSFYPVVMSAKRRLDKFEDKILDDADSARLGFEGENTVAEWLKQILPKDKYFVLPNFVLPGHRFDIDFIVIGPKGVIILEVKNYTGQFQFSDDEYFQIKNGQKNVLPPSFDPRDEARRHAYYLRKYFELNGYNNVRILKAVVFVNANRMSIDGNTGVYVAGGFDSLKKFLD